MKFPYKQYTIKPSAISESKLLYRPMVPLRLVGPAGEAFFWALVDTGADNTLLPRSIGFEVGIAFDEEQAAWVTSYGGHRMSAAPADVRLQLSRDGQAFHWSAKVGFVKFENPENEVALLGHTGCLNYFHASFDGEAHEVELVPTPEFPGAVTGGKRG